MRKLIVEAEVSLDGIVNSPDIWGEVFKHHSKDVTDYLHQLLLSQDALVLGRKTYEAFAKVWPEMDNENAEKINGMPKYVASRTLDPALDWNATLIEGNIPEEILRLKQENGNNLLQYGIGELTHTMLKNKLIDEIQLIVYPFTFGKGERWFDVIDVSSFGLLDSKSFSSGAILLRYQPK
ncbi:dihydrofolate reductase family protein [Sinomicrobium weinanense]|uniref:Dihydrofolate reductase family protein n=1 Tax=Sinomicrobium weinanense TaxID=2842200 RepID=A0A926Q4Q4_9FLAO|nr:dihydrofolate reductase family protein [Sinomicrobium weinanense]MBC9798234.1 dihydrofolate reductase family protein [Sinomicrobium weinanense]MBU3125326.1 dihydrofolate reductase family protein [Sinomicrobium weinanense]